MSRALSEAGVVSELADQMYRRLTRRMISALQRMKNCLLSGDDSGLENTWDEICAQIQLEAALTWDAYDDTVRRLAASLVERLPSHEREAMWLQTPEAAEWACEDESRRLSYPVLDDEIIEHLVSEYVYSEAGSWTNVRIREYLDRSG